MSIPEKNSICQMFNQISDKYDLLNQILSFGIDRSWRKRAASFLPKNNDMFFLDVATGTADFLLAMLKNRPNIKRALGVDLAEDMLNIGQKKINSLKLSHVCTLIKANACDLPFLSNSFDAVGMAFGIRNVDEKDKALKEILRVLKPKGIALILEFSLPHNIFIKQIYLFYFRYIMPFIGGIISSNFQAYRYLQISVENFFKTQSLIALMQDTGFREVYTKSLSFGIATIYVGKK